MTQHEVFLLDILAHPWDSTPRLVYADWLEDQANPHAGAVRKYPQLGELIAGLGKARNPPRDKLRKHALAGRIDLLAALAFLLDEGRDLIRNAKAPEIGPATVRCIETLLAETPGLAALEALLERRLDAPTVGGLAAAAVRQPLEVLQPLFTRYGGDPRHAEFLGCFLQELILQGADLRTVPAVVGFREAQRERGHPLAYLPLRRFGFEAWAQSTTPRTGTGSVPGVGSGVAGPFHEVTDAKTARRLVEAVRNWQEQSNGRVAAHVFALDEPLTGPPSAEGLEEFGLACGLGPVVGAGLLLEEAAAGLYFSASSGGAYNRGVGRVYGRLAMWRSLSALAGASADTAAEEVAELAERCIWVELDCPDWFYRVAWDLGVLAVRPDGRSVALLAATDTD